MLEDKLLEWPGPRPQGSWESPSQAWRKGGFRAALLLSRGSRAAQRGWGKARRVCTRGWLSVKAAGSRLGSDSAVVLAGPVFPLGAAGHLGRHFTVLPVSLLVRLHYHHRGRQAVTSVCPVTHVTSVPA